MGAHRPDPEPSLLGISVALMIWTTGEYPVSDDAWPESMVSMAPASSCAMDGLSGRLRRPVQGKIHDKDDERPRRGVDSLKKPISRA